MKYAIVVSEFNEEVVSGLLRECLRGFEEQGISPLVYKVPGAVEIPLMAQFLIQHEKVDGVVALGCVIQGGTDHYKAVCEMCAQGIMEVMLKTGAPIVFEVLMVDDEEKALERVSKGYEAAFTVKRMVELLKVS